MTIPEASQLVIQASAMSNGGEVFLLDMGEPIRVYDLAQRMINLATRDNEREINASTSEETTHKKIYKSLELGPSLELVREQLLLLDVALNEQNLDSVLAVLQELVEGYSMNSLASKLS